MSGTNERIHSAAEARGHERHKLPVSRLLELLNTWTHKLDAEILVPSGRKQLCYDLGVAARVRELLVGFVIDTRSEEEEEYHPAPKRSADAVDQAAPPISQNSYALPDMSVVLS
ncbi:hypothetical protein FOMPIDRAFT_1056035 [Fomitopsis schrenkii]|uniref:Uncharacterized protein n=1 Tax=Fomitopsis schrenkii TaxID=2126942 RepID=S8DQA0_FOMSC|nr:hypothetical protein FOMPIDRAFT_1056035 [Fomitopsis schrenkii]